MITDAATKSDEKADLYGNVDDRLTEMVERSVRITHIRCN
jgi:hypothetical protein